MKFKFKHLAVATLSLSLVLNQAGVIAAEPQATDVVTTVGIIKIEGGEINLNYTGTEQNLINISDYYKGTGTVKYRVGDSGDFSTTVPTATDAGKYDVYYYILGDSDYNNYDAENDPTSEEARLALSPSHVVVNIVAQSAAPSSDSSTVPSSDSSTVPSSDSSTVPSSDSSTVPSGDSSTAPSSDSSTAPSSDSSAAPSSDSSATSGTGNSSSSSSKSNVPMTINYSVAADGTTSTVIDRKGLVWLREESDGTGAWYGIDNSDGAFELGSTFHVKWLKEGDEEYAKYFSQLDDTYKKKAETNNIEIFLVGVTKPDGKTEYTNFGKDVGLYVQLGDDWDANDINALFIAEGSDSPVTVQYGTADKFMSLYEWILFPEVGSKYARLTLTHFSPYAVVGAKKSDIVSPLSSFSSDLSSYSKALSTKTGEDYSKILCLLSISSISLLYVLILRKRKFLG